MDLLQKKCVPCEGPVPPMKEEEAHYKEVTLIFTTHAIQGLSDNDFIMAAKVNKL